MRKPILKKLIGSAPGAKPVYLYATGWLEGKSAAEIKLIYRDYKAKLKSQTAELTKSLGKPARSLPTDRSWFDRWYPESLAAAAWECGDKMICLAVEHHDRETPVALVLRCLTHDGIDELAA